MSINELRGALETQSAPGEVPALPVGTRSRRWQNAFAFRKIGGVYILLGIILIFTLWVPNTFPEWATVKQILNGNGVTALFALSLIIPLSAGAFDISGAYTMSLSGVLASYLIVNGHVPVAFAVLAGLAVGVVVGVVNGIVVVGMNIDSLIGTLATGSLIQAAVTMITNDNSINSSKLAGSFSDIAQASVGGISAPVLYAAGVAVIIWFLLDHTSAGRRLYATGFNKDAARLAGIRTESLRFTSLVLSSTLAAGSGIVLASTIGSGSPTAGNPYLLSGFAAVFLGATQLKEGKFNAFGTIIAVLLLGTGVTGLGLANAPAWCGNTFTGVVLISALAVTGIQRRRGPSARSLDVVMGRLGFLKTRRASVPEEPTASD